jgi:Kef-type K+ transport system membrane component KefB
LQKKLLYLTGLEFLFIGVLIGEPFVNFFNKLFKLQLPILLDSDGSLQLRPVIAAILGAVGFSVGLQFRIKELFNYKIEHFKLAINDILFTIILMSGISFFLIYNFFNNVLSLESIIANSLIIGISASTFSQAVLESIQNKFEVSGSNFNTLQKIPKVNNFIALTFLGLMFAILHIGRTSGVSITPIEWFVINIALGLLIGFLFFVFLEREENETKLLVALLGIIIFSSGAAYYMNFSPLFINMLVGFVIGNAFQSKEVLTSIFKKLEHPFYVIISIYAGATIRIDNFWLFLLGVFLYVVIRMIVKYFNGWLSYHSCFDKSKFSSRIGLGLNTQGIIAITMAVNFQQVYNNPLTNTIFAIIIFGVLVNEILSTKLTKDLLLDLSEIK